MYTENSCMCSTLYDGQQNRFVYTSISENTGVVLGGCDACDGSSDGILWDRHCIKPVVDQTLLWVHCCIIPEMTPACSVSGDYVYSRLFFYSLASKW